MGEITPFNVSIIVPVYNSEKTIAECIKSLKNQNYRGNFEIIVVDDGSIDNTAKIAEKNGAIVFRQKNAGPAKARNLGAQKAKGEIFLFTDADCISEKNWISEMVKPFSDSKVAGVQGAYKTKQKSTTAKFNQLEIEYRYERMKRLSENLDWIGSYSAGYRKKDYFEANGFDESFPKASGEDPELSYKISKKGKKLVFNEKAIVYHKHPETILRYLQVKFHRAYYRVLLYSKHKDKILRDSYTPKAVKLEVFVLPLAIIIGIIIGIYNLSWGIITGILFALITPNILSANFLFFTIKTDFLMSVFSKIIIPLRAWVFTLGMIKGFIDFKILGKIK